MIEQEFADRVAELVKDLTGAQETTGTMFDIGTQVGIAIHYADLSRRHGKREYLGQNPIYSEVEAERLALIFAHYFNGWRLWMQNNER